MNHLKIMIFQDISSAFNSTILVLFKLSIGTHSHPLASDRLEWLDSDSCRPGSASGSWNSSWQHGWDPSTGPQGGGKVGGEENNPRSWTFSKMMRFFKSIYMFVYGTWNVGRTSWRFIVPYDTLRVYQAFWMSLMGLVIIFSNNPRRLKLKLPFPISSVHISTLTKQLTWFHAWKLCAHIHTHIYLCEPTMEINWKLTVTGNQGFLKSEVFPCEHVLQNPTVLTLQQASVSRKQSHRKSAIVFLCLLTTCQKETWDMTKITWPPPWKSNQPRFRRKGI